MKNFFFTFCLLFGLYSFGQFEESAIDNSSITNQSERILSFDSNVVVDTLSGITVTEKIKVLVKGDKIQRGIYRALPKQRNLNNQTHNVKYKIISIKRDLVNEDYHTKNEDGYLKIYLGNKNYFLPTGVYEYEIIYHTENQIGFFDDYDELYWNVTGNAWGIPIDKVTATVSLPNGAVIIQDACYTGQYGSNAQNCISQKNTDYTINWSTENLKIQEGLTVAVGFKKGIMIPPPPPGFLEKYGLLIGGFIVFLFLVGYYFTTWSKHGVDPQKPTVYPQFNVPQNLSPASLGYLQKGNFSNQLITASLVSLAIKGFLKITETNKSKFFGLSSSKSFTLKKHKEPDLLLPKEEFELMSDLFPGKQQSVQLKEKYSSKIERTVNNFRNNVENQHDTFLNKGNNRSKLWLPAIVITLVYGLGLFICNMIEPNPGKLGIGITFYIVLVVCFVFFTFFIREFSIPWRFVWFIPVILFYLLGQSMWLDTDFTNDLNYNICYLFLILSFTAFVIYAYLIKRPSEEKLETRSLIEGFKMYIGAAESEQLKFHNPPQMTPDLFEKILPFAIVFGVDDIWGKKFEKMLQSASLDYQNNWYIGGLPNVGNLGSSLNSSMSNTIRAASTAPSSSGSGSGGGGFSGGGGGGGGGGGW